MNSIALEELDLAIPNLESHHDEIRAGEILKGIPGINAVRFIERGAWISYQATQITRQQICDLLHRSGFRASTFQDSKSGQTGVSSV
ncbi:MAG TPA: hypothetical protein VIS74_05850 [Chthoniobacterales bacterium]